MKNLFYYLGISVCVLSSCDDDPAAAQQQLTSDLAAFESFTFPDSILRQQVVATFYDIHNPAKGIIYLTDTLGKNALMVRFMPNGRVQTDSLWRKSSSHFISIRSKAEYAITETNVNYFSGNFGSEQVRNGEMYLRTDNTER